MVKSDYQDRARGMLVGLAVGDALGAPYEFGYKSWDIEELGDKIKHYSDYNDHAAGCWTDDTSMALCIADSLLEKRGYDSYDVMDKYIHWWIDAYRSSDLHSFGIGQQTAHSLLLYGKYKIIPKDTKKTDLAGNGTIMRLAPIVIANYFPDKKCTGKITNSELKPLADMAILSCRDTHDSIAAECVTEMFATTLYAALRGKDKTDVQCFAQRWSQYENEEYDKFWVNNADLLIDRAFKDGEKLKDLGGYVVDAFAIALWGFVHSESFEDGMLKVLRLGGDVDTNAACYGQIAGAYYGYKAIPKEWRDGIYDAKDIVKLADKLLEMKECPIIRSRFEDDENFEAISNEDYEKSIEYYSRTMAKPKSMSEIMKERLGKNK